MKRACSLLLLFVLSLALGACAGMVPDKGTLGARRGGGEAENDNSHLPTGKPYTVRGQTYRPYTSANGFTEVGVASWYGPGFHGKLTANGERYNQNEMTAAHKLLPFNTRILVTNLDNGKSCVVRINDRGPFVDNRVIDLSNKAAKQVDMLQSGTARVRLEVDGEARGGKPVLTPEGDMLGSFYVQIGAFRMAANARRALDEVKKTGLPGRVQRNDNTGLHYVQVGPFPSVDNADIILSRLRAKYPGLFVIAQ